MQKEEQMRKCLKGMGVNSIGIYVHNETTVIAIHSNPDANRKDIRYILEFYLDGSEKIIL